MQGWWAFADIPAGSTDSKMRIQSAKTTIAPWAAIFVLRHTDCRGETRIRETLSCPNVAPVDSCRGTQTNKQCRRSLRDD